MTSLDAMKSAWEAQDRKMDEILHINRQLFIAAKLDKVRTPLRMFMIGLGIEIALLVMALSVVGRFLAESITEIRFVWPAVMIDVWLIFTLACTVRQFVAAKRIAFDMPIAALQRQIADLRILRLRAIRWELLAGQIVWWIPLIIIALKLFFGIDAYRYLSPGYIVANLLLGVALIPLAIWLAKRYESALKRSQFMDRLADAVAGYSLIAARNYAAMLSDFESLR
jgi:hypothetical protein